MKLPFFAIGVLSSLLLGGCGTASTTSPGSATAVVPSQAVLPVQRAVPAEAVAALRGAPQHRTGAIADKKGDAQVYVSDYQYNVVYGFARTGGSPTLIISTGIDGPQGLTTDKSGRLYVANTFLSQVLEYKPGSIAPVKKIADEGQYPADVAVDGSGNVWVANSCTAPSCGQGSLMEYSAKGALEATIVCENLYYYYSVAVDAAGDAFVDGLNSSRNPGLDEVAAGQSSCQPIDTSLMKYPGGIQVTTSGDLIVDDQQWKAALTFAAPSYGTVSQWTNLDGTGDPVGIALTKTGRKLWAADADSTDASLFRYPAGGGASTTLGGLLEPVGVAVAP